MSCGIVNLYANFMGFIVAISLTPALKNGTISGAKTTFYVLYGNLAIALLFLILGSICSKLEAKSKAQK